MIQELRHERMIDFLNAHEILSVEEAMALFAASPATIRRDFNDLADRGVVQRVRGGIKLLRFPKWDRILVAEFGRMPVGFAMIDVLL